MDAERLELRAKLTPLAVVEGAVAAAHRAAGHRLELGDGAHARAAQPRIVEASDIGIGNDALVGRRDEHEVAFADAVEQSADVRVGETHATLRGGPADQVFLIGAVEIDVAFQRVAPWTAIDPVLEPVEGEDAREDEIVGARIAAPHLAGRLAR